MKTKLLRSIQAATRALNCSAIPSWISRGSGPVAGLICFSVTSAALAQAAAKAPLAAAQSAVSDASQRKNVSLTVYNQDLGLVREVRQLSGLPIGRMALEYRDVASTIQPETVHIRALSGPGTLSVLEQNYRYDLLTPQTLLEKYVGKDVRVYRYHQNSGREDVTDARLLSVAGNPVLSINREITFDYGGRFAFPTLPENLIEKPTLFWLLDGKSAKQEVEVTYLAGGLNWSADYVAVLDDNEQRADLRGWVTLVNQSGSSYKDADLKLVAGNVNRVAPARDMVAMESRKVMAAPRAAQFAEEGLLEYHLYSLGRKTDVLNNEQKQVALVEAKGIGIEKKFTFSGETYWFRQPDATPRKNQKVGVYLEFENNQKNQLGMPLPKGVVRVYKADSTGSQQFVGEDSIDHTPRDERVRIKLGEAFDVVADRKQVRYTVLGECSSESTWEIEFRNHKDTAITIEDLEPASGDYNVVSSSQPAERKDANTFKFDVKVPARGKTRLNYVVRVRWC
ncbi:MAG TPA: DUF4139 domain-containing protein [Polyangiaceae bacterium]|nr:DUF4139 domain-containing protein [Polyangiaceae bacterium]